VKADLARVARLTSTLAHALYEATAPGEARAAHARGAGTRPGMSVTRSTPLLNLNVPREWNGLVQKARLGARLYDETIDFRTDPRGREYLWLGGPGVRHESDPGSDTDAYDAGFASLTPLVLDLSRSDDSGISNDLIDAVTARLPG
jgi:5'-nucleotidase